MSNIEKTEIDKSTEAPFTFADFTKVLSAIIASALLTHYLLQVEILCLGGRPNFEDTSSLAVNGAVMAFFLLLGWLVRRVVLVSILFLAFALFFFIPYLFVLKGSLLGWIIQFSTYTVLPLGSCAIFLLVCRIADVRDRPQRKPRLKAT